MELSVFNPADALDNIQSFLVAGGNVLLVIMIVSFAMWLFVVERALFFAIANGSVKKTATVGWEDRTETTSWYALAIRDKRISIARQEAFRNMSVIKVLVAILPLLGLLGTVTGMVEVFDVMASTGSSNARLMAGGITKATIPTMAGLVASLSGILAINILERQASRTVASVSDKLVIG
ncbi:MotA/TolQ/ExbB proton channel family protein [Parvularcula sp. LCG005]|uniref:MotA/TolQ/ExbB proton channel family protein n=1 Tax=Parvularcula sp. LCG005 TaxID=3078805 RepID=UPI002943B6BD|nr:MotA/TolQ/ExbB proton channel family protein [Parvularcula sp. LCG005]WOI53622.1 MotA/TolQ/ExbB proton channel family protein [Parvularcula sp. LCG005]